MLRLCLLTCAMLAFFAMTNKAVYSADTSSLKADQVSSECISCHEDNDGSKGSSHSGSHVIGIVYADYAARNDMLRPESNLPAELVLIEGVVTCASCHGADPHDGQSLVINNSGSALCSACHLM